MNTNFIPNMYRIIDQFDSRGLADMMTENAIFRFANMPPVTGRENIYQFLVGFFNSIKAIRHTDLEYWYTGNVWFATGNVNYTRYNDTVLTVSFSVILKMEGELIREYLVFVDASALYH